MQWSFILRNCLILQAYHITGKALRASKKNDKKIDLGDLLGRSKDGFQPLNTEEDADALSSDSDDMEEFSVPGMQA